MDVRKQYGIMVILATTFHHKTHLCRVTKGSDDVATILFLVYPYKWDSFFSEMFEKIKTKHCDSFL